MNKLNIFAIAYINDNDVEFIFLDYGYPQFTSTISIAQKFNSKEAAKRDLECIRTYSHSYLRNHDNFDNYKIVQLGYSVVD